MKLLPSKENLRRYVFEIIVIFIGITLGFLFDEWRENRTREHERIALMTSMKTELLRIKLLFQGEHSSIQSNVNEIKNFLSHPSSDTSTLYLIEDLLREVSFHQGTFSHVNALARSNASQITTNSVIAMNLSYIANMENDLARIKSDSRIIIQNSIWPITLKYGVDRDIYYLMNENTISLKSNFAGLIHDPLFESNLRLLEIKLNSLSGLINALIDRMDEILTEIESLN